MSVSRPIMTLKRFGTARIISLVLVEIAARIP